MEIPLIIVLIAAEALLILLGLSITLGIMFLRKPAAVETDVEPPQKFPEDELDAIDLGNSYIDFLEQAMQRNATKTKQQENIENETEEINVDAEQGLEKTEDENSSPAPDEAQSKLLLAREQFLLMEKSAAEKTEHEIHFWDSIYDGMKKILEEFSTIEETQTTSIETISNTVTVTESKDKVFYIETQGKKIDGEVNKLKDIIYEQENALSSMKKALEGSEPENVDAELLNTLREQMQEIERQLSDSKMCMEVLEMENNRLQEEVDNIDSRHEALFADDSNEADGEGSDSVIDVEQMREVVTQQENKIQQLVDTIESLEIDASQAEKLKETIGDFARTSKEMMSCITILEEENEKLQAVSNDDETADTSPDAAPANTGEIDDLKSTISKLEEDIIKKDVAHAQLQDEFTSMETEYLAMYEAMHGDNS